MSTDSVIPEFLMSQGLSAQSSRSWRGCGKRRNGIRLFTPEKIGSADASYTHAHPIPDTLEQLDKKPIETLTMEQDLSALTASAAELGYIDRKQRTEPPSAGDVIAELLSILKGEVFVVD